VNPRLEELNWTNRENRDAQDTLVATGGKASLAINSRGMGFIGYLQEEDYAKPDLMIALQLFQVFLPLTVR
jgi:hypothetical protein